MHGEKVERLKALSHSKPLSSNQSQSHGLVLFNVFIGATTFIQKLGFRFLHPNSYPDHPDLKTARARDSDTSLTAQTQIARLTRFIDDDR